MPFGDRELEALGNRLHARLLREDSAAVKQELSELFRPLLCARLRRRYPNLGDPHLCETAANDALLEYFEKRQKFDPQRGDLLHYLYFNASRDLLNIVDKERREAARRKRADASPATDADHPAAEWDSPLVRRAQAQVTNAVDAEILTLMMDGVRDTAEYAEVLGILDRPLFEQALLVKRNKDRVKAKVRRGLRRSRVPILVWLLTTRQRATAMTKSLIPSLAQVIAVAVLVGTHVHLWSLLKQTGEAKSAASGAPPVGIRHLDGERATINGISGTYVEKIFFPAIDGTGRYHIWKINPDGVGLEQVTFGVGDEGHVAISPDGTKLAFDRALATSDPTGPRVQSVWVKDLTTGEETRVTVEGEWPSGLYQSSEPAWSPDGTKIAFTRTPALGPDGPERFRSVWTIDVERTGSVPQRLTPRRSFGQIMPQWSPDGRHILCGKYLAEDARLAIYRIDLATGQDQEVIPWAGDEYLPRYSQDGKKVVWMTFRHTNTSDVRSDVYTADLADPIATQHRVSPYSGWGDPDWSPDGMRLVMTQMRFRLTDESLSRLEEIRIPHWLVQRLAGLRHDAFLEAKDLLSEAQGVIGEAATEQLAGRILARCDRISELWIANADGTGFKRLLASKSMNYSPRWGIVFQRDAGDGARP